MSTQRKLVHSELIPIRWGDMDAMGHVNNTVYFRYMEQVRVSWMLAVGNSVTISESEAPVIINASCTFLKPITYPGTVEAKMYIDNPGRSSFESYYELWVNQQLYAQGTAKMVWIDVKQNKAIPLPEFIKRFFE